MNNTKESGFIVSTVESEVKDFTLSSTFRSADEKAAILAEYKDRQHERCYYCHELLPVGTEEDPFFYDHPYGINSINFVTFRVDPFFGHTDGGDPSKKWICQLRTWDSE